MLEDLFVGADSPIKGQVATFAYLPATGALGDLFVVKTTTGVIGINRKIKGLYRWDGAAWVFADGIEANKVIYNNADSSLSAGTVKAAIDELDTKRQDATNLTSGTIPEARLPTIDADNTTVSNLEVDNLKPGVLDTDLSSVSANDDTLASAKAIKDYVDANAGGVDPRDSFTQNSGQHMATEGIRARDNGGIAMLNDAGTDGVVVADNGDVDITTKMSASEIEARNVNGLKLHDDGGSGILVKDGGNVGIGNSNPATKLVLEGANTKAGNGITFRADPGSGATDRLAMYAEHGSTFTFNQPADGSVKFTDHSDVDIFHISTWLQRVGVMNSNPRQKLSVGADLGSLIGAFGLGVQDAVVTGSANSNAVIGIQNWGSGSKLFSYNYGSSSATPISIQPDNANVYICQGGGNVGIGTTSPSQRLHVSGNAIVSGSLSKGSGSFDIPHPDPEKKDTHRLRHYFVETPSAGGNIYKYQLECREGDNYIDLPDYFEHLNQESLVWANPFKHFGRAWGEVIEGGKRAKIVCEQSGTYNILIFGDRKDKLAVDEFTKYGVEYKVNSTKEQTTNDN